MTKYRYECEGRYGYYAIDLWHEDSYVRTILTGLDRPDAYDIRDKLNEALWLRCLLLGSNPRTERTKT